MSRKPENTFISSVHKYLPLEKDLYRVKTHNPYTAGIPDWWYSGKRGDLWVEYKYLDHIPMRPRTIIIPALSDLQRKWLDDRCSEGRNTWVIVGCPQGGVLFNKVAWTIGYTTEQFCLYLEERQQLAEWIKKQVLL